MALDSMQEIFEKVAAGQIPFWQVILETDMEQRQVTAEQSMEKMRVTWQAMLESVTAYQGTERSRSGLVGGDGEKMRQYVENGKGLCGAYLREVVATALSVGESNACMRKIVAAPTAGACGVLPAVLVPLYQAGMVSEEQILQALYAASGIGAVIGYRACIAGAAGGCQAEIGTASAMAAGALTSIQGGSAVGHGAEKSSGPGVRPGGRVGGGPLREAERGGRSERRQLCGYGNGGHREPYPGGRGHRLHGRSRPPYPGGTAGDGFGRSGRNPHRQGSQGTDGTGVSL